MSSAISTGALPKSVHPLNKWKPAFYTPSKFKSTNGDELIAFAEAQFQVLKGCKAGAQLEFTSWHNRLLGCLVERHDGDGQVDREQEPAHQAYSWTRGCPWPKQ